MPRLLFPTRRNSADACTPHDPSLHRLTGRFGGEAGSVQGGSTLSIDSIIWNYRDGEPIGFAFDVIRDILSTRDTDWNSDGYLSVRFENPPDNIDCIYLGEDASKTNHVKGIMISRPICHPDYLARVFRILELGDVMMFYTDDTTPVFVRGSDPSHYPTGLLGELGTPRFIDSPSGVLHQT